MKRDDLEHAVELLEKTNAGLQPELLTAPDARLLLSLYARAEKLAGFGVAALTRKIDDPAEVARTAGTSMGKAKAVVATGQALAKSDDLSVAMAHGELSLDQAAEIAAAEQSAPGAAAALVSVATTESFQVLKEKARAVRLDAEQHRGLAQRQRDARFGRSYADSLGMVHIHMALEPHVGTPIVARAEAEAQRIARGAKADAGGSRGDVEPFERYVADAYARLLTGAGGSARSRRPELVVVVSHEVATRGWKDVRPGEVCKIPGVGPVAPKVAKKIAEDAFLSGVFYDGTDLRHLKRWSRCIPVEVAIALELGEPPGFEGITCVDCGNRFRTELDHVQPHVAGGPASVGNLKARCWGCHKNKTARDRRAGRLRPAVAMSGEP